MREVKFISNALHQTKKIIKISEKKFIEIFEDFDLAKEFILDKSRQIMITGGRRGCKTTSCAGKITHTNLFYKPEITDAHCFYAGRTFDHAMDLIWQKMRNIKRVFDISDWNMKDSSGKIETPRGNIRVLGLNDMDSIVRAMGMPFKIFIIDECQEHRDDVMRAVVRDGASWGSFDHLGTLILAGNPARSKHTFYAKEWLYNDNIKKYHTSIFKNPLKTSQEIEDFLEEQRKIRGLTKGNEDPEFRRMGFGEWVFDQEDQIFKPDNSNYYNSLPEGVYQYIIGVDVGYSAYDAIAVLAYKEKSKSKYGEVYLIEEIQERKLSMDQLTEKVHQTAMKYNVKEIVIDTGALVVKVLPEIMSRYSQYTWIPALKQQKMAWIENLKAEISRGTFKMKKDCIFDQEIPKIEYSADRKGLNEKLHHSDILMAIAYPFRHIYNYIALHQESIIDHKEEEEIGIVDQSIKEANDYDSGWDSDSFSSDDW